MYYIVLQCETYSSMFKHPGSGIWTTSALWPSISTSGSKADMGVYTPPGAFCLNASMIHGSRCGGRKKKLSKHRAALRTSYQFH